MVMTVSFRALALSLLATSSYAFTPFKQTDYGISHRTPSDLSMSADTADFLLNPEETAFVFIEYQNEFATVSRYKSQKLLSQRSKTRSPSKRRKRGAEYEFIFLTGFFVPTNSNSFNQNQEGGKLYDAVKVRPRLEKTVLHCSGQP